VVNTVKILDYFTFYDKILIAGIVLFSLIIIFAPLGFMAENYDEDELIIVIKSGSKTVKRIPMVKTYEKTQLVEAAGPLGISIIEAEQGRVRLLEAPEEDPQKICEKTGWISEPGPVIICVPNQISIWIETSEGDLDGITW